MSGKKKYSTELKQEMVQKYLAGNISIKELARQYHVVPGDIQKWRDAYLEHGVAGLCTTHGSYSGDFKVSVIEYIYNTGASVGKTTAHFNIPSNQSVQKWKRIYDEKGKEALYIEHRGRPTKMGTKRVRKPKSSGDANKEGL